MVTLNDFPDFQIEETIFRRGHRIVYRGWWKTLQQKVIIKTFTNPHPPLEIVAHMEHELYIARDLDCDGVIKPLALLNKSTTPALIFEDVGGIPLKDLIRNKPLSLNIALKMVISLTETLGQIHKKQIIHKDINPANVICNPETQQVWFTDFGISSRLTYEKADIVNPEKMEGTLPYMSPEQTGRMNRSLDYRSDYYSLGVTFYQMLTGRLPFVADEPMAFVHAHIAKQPESPHEVNQNIPSEVSAIVQKLMAKEAEDRYQSARGIKYDLEACHRALNDGRRLEEFEPGKHDYDGIFRISPKLYGRESDIQLLEQQMEMARDGGVELMLVSGYAGIGKSSLIRELHKPVATTGGFFIAGKYGKLNRDQPYSAISEALSGLVEEIMIEPEDILNSWRDRIIKALSVNGRLMIDLIPKLEHIIGEQAAPPELPPNEAQTRFQNAFINFIEVFASPQRPLVIFLDDLQWADSASLNLLHQIIFSDLQGTLVILAYRDNEVDEVHPLHNMIRNLEDLDVKPSRIILKPLTPLQLSRMVADSLQCSPDEVNELAHLVHTKTDGNPFFARRFLMTLYQRKLLRFDFERGCWNWNLEHIRDEQISDNVVTLLAEKMVGLADETRTMLQMGACIGNSFDLATLAVISKKSRARIAIDLWPAISEDFIAPFGKGKRWLSQCFTSENANLTIAGINVDFRFVHDRLQQAAYQSMSTTKRKQTHLLIGNKLWKNADQETLDRDIFEIVHHLNQAEAIIGSPEKRYQLAELNYHAGIKARTATAWSTALGHFRTAGKLINPNAWDSHFDFTFDLFMAWSGTEFQTAHFEEAARLSEEITRRATSPLNMLRSLVLRLEQLVSKGNYEDFTMEALKGLAKMGIEIPWKIDEVQQETEKDFDEIKQRLRMLSTDALIKMDEIQDRETLLILRIFWELYSSLLWRLADATRANMIAFKGVNYAMQRGNSGSSSVLYIIFAERLSSIYQDHETGYAFGELAMATVEKYGFRVDACLIKNAFSYYVTHWHNHLATCIPILQEAWQDGLDTGTIPQSIYTAMNLTTCTFFSSDSLARIDEEASRGLDFVKKCRYLPFANHFVAIRYLVARLKGTPFEIDPVSGEPFEETEFLERVRLSGHDIVEICSNMCLAIHDWFMGDKEKALLHLQEVATSQQQISGSVMEVEFVFLTGLCLASQTNPERPSKAHQKQQDQLMEITRKLQLWARLCPENFRHKEVLIRAQVKAREGKAEAMDLFEEAVRLARNNNFLRDEAIACILAVEFFLSRGQQRIAAIYLKDARYLLRRWGAIAVVHYLEQIYHLELPEENTQDHKSHYSSTRSYHSGETGTTLSRSNLDWDTFIKSSQAISGEIKLPILLKRLVNLTVENAGARSCWLLLKNDGQMYLDAYSGLEHDDVILPHLPFDKVHNLAKSIVNYVTRTRESLVLHDVNRDNRFSSDPHVIRTKPKSILCMPILFQSKLTGLVYMENDLVTNAFTADRLKILQILAAQAAISIENASLYQTLEDYSKTLEDKVDTRTQELTNKNEQILSSIRYARRIQGAILPSEQELDALLPEHFVLFRPRDIVSGDFYWLHQSDNILLLAVVDCTGHGVPGAFVSMIAHTLLNKIVVENAINQPAEILERLDRNVGNALRQQSAEGANPDGMEISLCRVDLNTREVTFCGAHRPLYRIKVLQRKSILEVIRGNARSINDSERRRRKPFKEAVFKAKAGDLLYLTSDGYADQQNLDSKKFGARQFKQLLCEISAKPLKEQKQILQETLTRFQGFQKQRDDITILGIKL